MTPVQVLIDPPSGHPTAQTGGLPIRVRCVGGEPPYCIDFGDGTEITTLNGYAEHVYNAPYSKGEYRVRATCDTGGGSATVTIENEAPVFHGIFSVKGQRAAEKEMVLLQVNHFTKGCRGCPPCDAYQVFGGEDPDGDLLFYEWHIRREGEYREDAVYDLSGNRVDGVPTAGEYFVWFPMWQQDSPLLPMTYRPEDAEQSMTTGQQTAQPPFKPMGFYHTYVVSVTVSDYCGASNTFTTRWEVLEMDN